MRMLVLGAGLQGSACAYDLLRNDAVQRVLLADVKVADLPPFLEPFAGDPRLERVAVDARDAEAVRALLARADACMNALPYYFNFEISRLAVEAGIHYCDLGGNTEIVLQQLELDAEARENGISIVPDCGLAPGMVNILGDAGAAMLDRADSLKIRVGGLPQHPRPPLNYQIVYSLEGVLDYYTTPSWIVRDGRTVQVDALSDVERIEFPEPVGNLEAFHTAGGLSIMAWTHEGRIRNMEYKTLRYPGHADIMRAIRELGLLGLEPVDVKGTSVVPRDMFMACAEPRLRRPGGRDLVALRVEVEGEKAGAPARVMYDLIDFFDESAGVSAMERTTGYSLSITGQLQVEQRVLGPGVKPPYQAISADVYIAELAERGIDIRRRTETTVAR